MPSPPIDQKISLSGDEDVRKRLEQIGVTSEASFKKAEDAANKTASTFNSLGSKIFAAFNNVKKVVEPLNEPIKKLGESFKNVGEQVDKVGRRFGLEIAAGVGATAFSFFELAKGFAETADHLKDISHELGISTGLFQQMEEGAARTGDGTAAFEKAFSRLSTTVAETADKQKEAYLGLLNGITDKTQTTGVQIIGQVDDQKKRIIQSYAQIGDSIDTVLPHLVTLDKEFGAGRGAAQIKAQINQIASGTDAAGLAFRNFLRDAGAINTATLTISERLGTSTDKARTALQKLGIDVLDSANKTRSLDSLLPEISTKLNDIRNESDRSALAIQLFGRSGVKLLPILKEFAEDLEAGSKGGLSLLRLTEQQIDAGDKLSGSFALFSLAIKRAKDQIAAPIAPVFSDALDNITKLIIKSVGPLQQFGATIATKIKPIVDDFVKVLEGAGKSGVTNKWIVDLVNGVKGIPGAIGAAIPVIVTAFQGIVIILETIAGLINTIFGTDLNATSVAAVLIIGKMTGAFGLLSAALSVAKGSVVALTEAFELLAASKLGVFLGLSVTRLALIGTLILLIINYIEHWNELNKGVADFFAAMGLLAEIAFKIVGIALNSFVEDGKTKVTDFFSNFTWDNLKLAATDAFNWVVAGLEQMGASFANFFSQQFPVISALIGKVRELGSLMSSIFGGGGPPGLNAAGTDTIGFSGGGAVPGSGRGDIIRANLEPGEFVVRGAAVRRVGLGFMRALNNLSSGISGFNFGALMPGTPQFFSGGGPVLATGGASGVPVHLHLGGETFVLQGDRGVVNTLQRSATRAKMRSAGTMPTRKA